MHSLPLGSSSITYPGALREHSVHGVSSALIYGPPLTSSQISRSRCLHRSPSTDSNQLLLLPWLSIDSIQGLASSSSTARAVLGLVGTADAALCSPVCIYLLPGAQSAQYRLYRDFERDVRWS